MYMKILPKRDLSRSRSGHDGGSLRLTTPSSLPWIRKILPSYPTAVHNVYMYSLKSDLLYFLMSLISREVARYSKEEKANGRKDKVRYEVCHSNTLSHSYGTGFWYGNRGLKYFTLLYFKVHPILSHAKRSHYQQSDTSLG